MFVVKPPSGPRAKKSFEIETSEDFYRKLVVPSYEEYCKNENSRNAIVAAIFCWHLHDWIWQQYEDRLKADLMISTRKHFKEYLFQQCSDFRVIDEVANGSKHFETLPSASVVGSTQSEHGFLAGPSLGFGTVSHYTVTTSDGRRLVFLTVLMSCNDFWKRFLAQFVEVEEI